jgi:hypothetical protein
MSNITQPFFSSRKWIKVWITEWRDGTLRWQATDFQRAFWIDLLTLAGRSRYPGIVCAGKDASKVVGYPASFLAQNSQITAGNIEETLDLFKLREMLTYTKSKSVNGETLYAITITNWKKYQSDYDSNKKYQQSYRERKKASSPASSLHTGCLTSQLVERKTLEREVDLEGDKEGDKEEAEATAAAFHAFKCEPFGPKKFQTILREEFDAMNGDNWSDMMERVAVRSKESGVKVPGRFFAHKREVEKLEAPCAYRSTPL